MRYMTLAFSMVFAASMAWAQGLGPINGGPMNGPITVPKPCGGGQCGGPPVQPQRNPQTQPQPQAQPQNQNLPQPNQGDLPDSAYGPTVPVSPQMVEWNRLANSAPSLETLNGWRALAEQTGRGDAWMYYGYVAWRLQRYSTALEGLRNAASRGCNANITQNCNSLAGNTRYLEARVSPPMLTVTPHAVVPGEPPPAISIWGIDTYKGALDAYQQDRLPLLQAAKKKLDDEEADINTFVEKNRVMAVEYQKAKGAFDQHPSSSGYESLKYFANLIKTQNQTITQMTLAWAEQKKKNNIDLEETLGNIKVAKGMIETISQAR